MTPHHDDAGIAEGTRERSAILWLHTQQVGVAEFVAAIPERRAQPHRGAEMKHRQQRHARDRERHDRGSVVMTYNVHVRPRLENLAVDYALRIGTFLWRHDRVGVEIVFEDVGGLNQAGGTGAREEIA